MYEIIKGECLAMRAYCHFDLLRLFGPMPTRTTASKILPYVTKVGIEYNTHHSYQEFTELLENDLTDAGKLLYPFDPVIPAGEDREELNLSLSAENFLTAEDFKQAFANGYTEPWELAEYFDLPEADVLRAFAYWRDCRGISFDGT